VNTPKQETWQTANLSESVASTHAFVPNQEQAVSSVLCPHYDQIQLAGEVTWAAQYKFLRPIGYGSQSVVYLADRFGSLNVSLRVALKLFSPVPYQNTDSYLTEMARTAEVAMRIGEIQQDSLLDVHNMIESGSVQIMVMEWVDGFDLKQLTAPDCLAHVARVSGKAAWEHINDVVVTAGSSQARLKPGVAIAILRECLEGLAPLHRRQIVHGDIKPANIMLKKTGDTKIIDFGSAFFLNRPRIMPAWTPRYAAPEVITDNRFELNSDVASLGYVFLELLSGRVLFADVETREQLAEAKVLIHERLVDYLPGDVLQDSGLVELISDMIHPDPAQRFSSPEEAEESEHGAAAAHRRLIRSNLDSDYKNEIRDWLKFVSIERDSSPT
jgi:serine/threonine protein kinase